jgi:hypothetical protein
MRSPHAQITTHLIPRLLHTSLLDYYTPLEVLAREGMRAAGNSPKLECSSGSKRYANGSVGCNTYILERGTYYTSKIPTTVRQQEMQYALRYANGSVGCNTYFHACKRQKFRNSIHVIYKVKKCLYMLYIHFHVCK